MFDAADKRQRVESDMSDSSLPAMSGHAVHVPDNPDAGAIAPKIAPLSAHQASHSPIWLLTGLRTMSAGMGGAFFISR